APSHWGADSTAADQSQLLSPTAEQAHCPRSRFSASVLIRVVCAGAAAPSREVPFAVRLGVPTRAGDLGISVRHAAALSDLRSWRHWPPERAVCVSTSPLTKYPHPVFLPPAFLREHDGRSDGRLGGQRVSAP